MSTVGPRSLDHFYTASILLKVRQDSFDIQYYVRIREGKGAKKKDEYGMTKKICPFLTASILLRVRQDSFDIQYYLRIREGKGGQGQNYSLGPVSYQLLVQSYQCYSP